MVDSVWVRVVGGEPSQLWRNEAAAEGWEAANLWGRAVRLQQHPGNEGEGSDDDHGGGSR